MGSLITVKKIKGHQAIVETTADLEVGQTYELNNANISVDSILSKPQSRQNSIHLGAQIQTLTGSTVQEQRLLISGRYGWNFEKIETGPTLIYQSLDLGSGADIDFFAGGYVDYNLQKNKAPNAYIWGPTFNSELGTKQFKSGGSASLFNFELGGFLTWFLAETSTALRIQGGYHYQKVATTILDTTLTGFNSKAYLVFYY